MYIPRHFSEDRNEVLHELIRACPLGVLVTTGLRGLEANHIPFILQVSDSGSVKLLGHVARANPVWDSPGGSAAALVIFQGPAAYISPGWYPSKQEHGKVVPTWNYVAVHAEGTLQFRHEADWIRNQIELLTSHMEAGQPRPWAVSDAPADFVDKMIANLVGIELDVDRLVGKWKLSQNQSAANRAGVIRGLEQTGDSVSASLARLVAASAE